MSRVSCTNDEAADEAALSGGAVDIETALNKVGVGRFQWMALLVCGLANAADAVEILGMSLVLPAAEGDPNFELTPSGKSALSSCIFLGMLLGGVLWGPMGDVLGRRRSLLVALLINAFFGAMSAGTRSVGALVAMRLLGGVGVGGSVPVVFSFLAELLPAKSRGKFMVGLAAHWMVGSIFSAGMGWAIIPTAPDGWRVFLAVASLPAWCAALGTWFMPESPRFLLVQGDTEAAEQVLEQMSAINNNGRAQPIRLIPHKSHHLLQPPADGNGTGVLNSSSRMQDRTTSWQHAHDQPSQQQQSALAEQGSTHPAAGNNGSSSSSSTQPGVQTQVAPAAPASAAAATAGSTAEAGLRCRGVGHSGHHDHHHQQQQQQQQRSRKDWKQQQRQCCKASLSAAKLLLQQPLRRRFLPLLVAWLGLCGGWYSTVLWIPEFFKARGVHSASLYAETFAVAAANLPGNIASIFMVDWLGRRLTACICLAGACVAALLFAFAPADPLWSVAAACIFNGVSVGGWNALDLLSAELFATEVRSTAMGLLGASGRLASFTTTFVAGALMQWVLWSPLLVAAALLAAGSIAIMLLPEMAHKPLEDTIEDAEDSETVMTVLTGGQSDGQSLTIGQTSGHITQGNRGRSRGYGSSSAGHVMSAGGGRSWSGQQQQQQQQEDEVELAPVEAHAQSGVTGVVVAGSSTGRAAAGQGSEQELKAEEQLSLLRASQ